MRIIAGEFRGRILKAPHGLTVRPTGDRARETLFDILGPRVVGTRFLDLFAGTGAVGLEALSRGAAEAVFVENHPPALTALRANVEALGLGGRVRVLAGDWRAMLRILAREGSRFDIAFADPPYDTDLGDACLRSPEAGAMLKSGGLAILEQRRSTPPPEAPPGFRMSRSRRAGESLFSFYAREDVT
jgi:16S rRNA (guanine(966)-N(2))-methyltransferase RsmD